MLEQVPVTLGLTGVQVVTGALSAFLTAKRHAGGSLSGFVYSEKVDQSSIPEHKYFSLSLKIKLFTFYIIFLIIY